MTRRLSLAVAALVTVCFAAPAAAQSGRAQGLVRDVNGHPVRSAIVHAHNDNSHHSDVQSATAGLVLGPARALRDTTKDGGR